MKHLKRIFENDNDDVNLTRDDLVVVHDLICDLFEHISTDMDVSMDDIYFDLSLDSDTGFEFNKGLDEISDKDLESTNSLRISMPFFINFNSNRNFNNVADIYIEYLNLLKSLSKQLNTIGMELLPEYFYINDDESEVIIAIEKYK